MSNTSLRLSVVALSWLLFVPGIVGAEEAQRSSFVILNAQSFDDVRAVIEQIEIGGGHVRHVFPNRALIADGVSSSLTDHPLVADILDGEVDAGKLREKHGDDVWPAVSAWFSSRDRVPAAVASTEVVAPIENDALKRPRRRGPGDVYYPTTEYMAGSVSVGLVLPECVGGACTEDPWTTQQLADVFSEVVGGMDWWIDRASERGISLTFVYDQGGPILVPTQYEPINMTTTGGYCEGYGDHFIWVEDVLHSFGYSGDCFEPAYEYLEDMRVIHATDWAFAVFIANSLSDPDGSFPDDSFAAAWWGGPFLFMTYDNHYYGIGNMDAVSAHETGHMFWALDQYASLYGDCTGLHSCLFTAGYLAVENQNCEYCDATQPSIMASNIIGSFASGALDDYGAGQIGWWDTDEDGLPDVTDTAPAVLLDRYVPDPTENHRLTYSGVTWDVPMPNVNPASWNPQVDITINEITAVQFRIDDGTWYDATALDGAFNDSLEHYSFVTDSLPAGTHIVEVATFNSVGNQTAVAARDTVTITDWVGIPGAGVVDVSIGPVVPNPTTGHTLIHFGIPAPVSSTVDIYALSGRHVRSLVRGRVESCGRQAVTWDGRDDSGQSVASGVYFCCLQTESGGAATKLLLLK